MVPDVIPSVPAPKQYRDQITAHKIALLVIVKEFCTIKIKTISLKPFQVPDEDTWVHTNKQNREIAIALLKLIQNPDLSLKELNSLMQDVLHPRTYQMFLDRLKELRKTGIGGIMDYIQTLEPLLVDPTPTSPVVHKSSVIGLFIRRMLLAFDKLTFSQVTKLCNKYYAYYDAAFGNTEEDISEQENQESDVQQGSDSDEEGHVLASQKQAEFFIAQQAGLLQINENEALSPNELQRKIRDLLKGNPQLTEAHYLSFLNTLRVKEFCGAMENLYHHFDRNTSVPQESKVTPASEDASRSFRYAALNLAILHARFGHREEALAALKEAIMVAQEVNDNVCLQHALVWLYRLCPDNKEILVERSVSKSGELNLWYLSSLGIQALSKMKSVTTATPISVLDLVIKGDILNCRHSMTEVMGTAYALRAALWTHYGNSCMSNLISQLLLHLNTSDSIRGGVYHIGEGTCIALCNLATAFAAEGEYSFTVPVLNLARQLFPSHSEHSHLWKLCDLFINFEKALNCGSWVEAEKMIGGMAIFDAQEAKYRTAQLLLSQGNLTKAYEIVKKLVTESETCSPHFHSRVLLLKASILSQTPNYCIAIPPLMLSIEVCKTHHLMYLEALSILYLASIQLMLGLPSKAVQMLDSMFVMLLAHGSSYDKGCCYMLYAKCLAATTQTQESGEDKKKILLTAASMCDTAINYFQKVKAVHRTKYCLCWQAHLYNQLGMITERNFSAHRFSALDQQYPCTNWNGVVLP